MRTATPQYNIIKQGSSRPGIMGTSAPMRMEEEVKEIKREQSLSRRDLNTSLPKNLVKSPVNNLSSSPNGVNTLEETFTVSLQNAISGDQTQTIAWQYNIPSLAANEKQLILDLVGGQYMILQSASPNIPQELFLYCDQVSGYQDKDGVPTNIIGIYRIKQIFQISIGGTMTYTAILSMNEPLSWPLGMQQTLTFRIGDKDGIYSLPTLSPANLQFKILHVCY